MLTLNNNNYRLVLLDTNVLSELLRDPKSWITYFQNNYGFNKIILGYSIFTLAEIYKAKPLFNKYLEIFSIFPSVILDGYDSIFRKEIENYHSVREEISPIVIPPFAIIDNNIRSPKERLKKTLLYSDFFIKSDEWKGKREEILNGILDLKRNFPAKSSKYTISEAREFAYIATAEQVMLRDPKFSKDIVVKKRTEININKFPSVLSTSYVVFYKFYPDDRKPTFSDVFDIIISSIFPYVNVVFTEKHLCEIIRKVKKLHKFLPNLEFNSLTEIKNEIMAVSK